MELYAKIQSLAKIFNWIFMVGGLPITVSIRIVAECGSKNFQFTIKLKRATTLEFTTISAIIFIHCYSLAFLIFFQDIFNLMPELKIYNKFRVAISWLSKPTCPAILRL